MPDAISGPTVDEALNAIVATHVDCLACAIHIDHSGPKGSMEVLAWAVKEAIDRAWSNGYETGRRSDHR